MANSRIRAKVRRRKVAHLAAYSRQFTVSNNTIPKTELNQKNTVFSWSKLHLSKYDVDTYGNLYTYDKVDKDGCKVGFHLVERDCSWKPQKYKQPKRLRKKDDKHPSTFPTVVCKKMTRQEYWEKLAQHKLQKWERKNPCPIKEDKQQEDLFKAQFLDPWKEERAKAEERFRDVVVSMYDKLLLTGRFKMKKEGQATYQEEEVAKLKDIDGNGHHVNEAPKDSKLIQKAQKTTNQVKAKRQSLVCTTLRDHKRQKGRIILPNAA